MKQVLAFMTSDDFEDFTSQLIGQELPSFVAVEGAGGDGGLDGLDETTAYQMYFPEPKHRDSSHYITKINKTLSKLQLTIQSEGLEVTRWVLVIPEDLQYKVVIHLQKKSKELGIECIYWGATKLTALIASHPQIRDNFPEVFLPDVKQDLGDVKTGIARLHTPPRTEHGVEIMTDQEYTRQKEVLRQDLRGLIRSGPELDGTKIINSGYRADLEKKFSNLEAKKKASDRAYELDEAEINDHFDDEVAAKKSELQKRGLGFSGIGQQEIEKIEVRRDREIERLRMKYGKGTLPAGWRLRGNFYVKESD